MNQKNNLIIGLIIAGVVIMSANVDADPRDFVEGLPNIGIMLQEITEVDSSLFVTAFWSMLETIEMAFIGTVVGVAISLPLSLLAARNLNSKFVYVPIRALLAAIRTFPTVYMMIASTPANGPRPTIITNKIAQSIEGKVRIAASNARIGT